MSRFLIYALVDPRDNEIRYIGRSSSGLTRPRQRHVGHCGSWIKQLKTCNLKPDILVLEDIQSSDELSQAEIRWISKFRSEGKRLTNLTDGGEGLSNPPPEVRMKLRLAKLGKKLSEEHKRKISEGNRGKIRPPVSLDTRLKMRLAKLGKTQSLSTKMKRANSLLGRKRGNYKMVNSLKKRVIRNDGHIFSCAREAAKFSSVSLSSVLRSLYLQKKIIRGYSFSYVTTISGNENVRQ